MDTDDPKYAIYRINVTWVMDGAHREHDKPDSWQIRGLPEGRRRNATGFTEMYRDDPGLDGIRQTVTGEWWPAFKKKGENPSDPTITIERQPDDCWCQGWFDHWTFDIGQSDADVLVSFERFLERKGVRISYSHDEHQYNALDPDVPYSAMGAEDRWRWRGQKLADGGHDDDNRTEPPCRCDGCRKRGVIRIIH